MSLSPRWPQTAIGDFAEVATGGTPSTAKSEYWESGTIPWLNSGELNKGLIYQSENFITQSGLNNSSAQMMPKETVLIALTGATTGVSALLKMEACANQSVTGVLPSPHHNPSFLLHFLRSIRPKILSDSYGGAQKHISQGYVKQLKVPLPPLTEQRRIAAILDQAEALRTKRRAALAKLDALAQSIFLEMFGDPITNPKNWPMVPMASMFAAPPIFGTMIPPSEDGGEWLSLRVANIQNWKLDLSDRKYVQLPMKMISRHSVIEGDLLLARAIASQDHLGKCVVVKPGAEKWAFDSHLMRIRFDRRKAIPEFIRQLLRTPGGRSLFLKATRRTAVQFNINTKELSGLRVPLPPITLQGTFLEKLLALDRLGSSGRSSLSQLDTLFESIQYRAFRGDL